MTAPRLATEADVPSWCALARSVEPLFGPMPGIAEYLRRGIGRGTAIVVGEEGAVEAGMLLSRDGAPHTLSWLATDEKARGRGHGGALLRYALDRWPTGDVTVVTFTADTPGGEPARRLYERFGFVYEGPTDLAPDGGPRDLYRLSRPE